MAYDGAEASPEAIEACSEAGVDIRGHGAHNLTADMLERADFVYVMDRTHHRAVMELAAPGSKQDLGRRVDFLRPDGEIADPIGMTQETYRRCAKEIAQSVRERLDEIL